MRALAAMAVSIPFLVPGIVAESSHPEHSVTAVRHWTVGDVTRVAIEVSGEFQYRSDRLHQPERLYFDILNARPRLEGRRLYAEDVPDKRLKRVRVAETTPGITRVVLDLAEGVEGTPSQLSNPYRLMIELRAEAPAPSLRPLVTQAPPVVPNPPASLPAPPVVTASVPQIPKLPSTKPEPPVVSRPEPVTTSKAAPSLVKEPITAEPAKSQEASASSAPPVNAKLATLRPPETPAPSTGAHAEPGRPARPIASGESSLIRTLGLKINRVVIDPGHGGHDQGTTGPRGLLEKDVVLDVALRLGKLIEDRLGAEVIYTRTDDTFIPLEGRTALANDKKADLFLSIHANSSSATHVSGIETYYLNFTDSKDALDVAARENASSEKSVFELRDLIQQITLHDKAEESREFAIRIQSSLFALSARNFPGEKNRGVKKAPFVVLIGANMPSVLAEIGFLSNPKEENLLRKPEYRDKVAEALFRGLSRYATGLSHFQVAQN